MAKFRKNHSGSSRGSGFMMRGIVLTIALTLMLLFAFAKLEPWFNSGNNIGKSNSQTKTYDAGQASFLPEGSKGEIINHSHYSLAYNEENEQADWVAYRLTKASLQVPNVERSRQFRPDYKVSTRSAIHSDYTRSGYTRGHLAPAGDMAFSKEAMEESFIMSNMSPQVRPFNNGIWKELEETVRDWAYYYEDIYVVSGPVFESGPKKYIGKNRVAVPDAFFKVILDNKHPYEKMIAFLIPHEMSDEKLENYALTVDDLEARSGLEFFDSLLEDQLEEKLEAAIKLDDWPFDEKRYQLRINKWNKEN